MSGLELGRRFWESTRGQLLTLIRRGDRTVEELAQALEVSDNAVRNHLAALERDNLVVQSGFRRGTGAGKPAVLYDLHSEAAPLFSHAYAPVLATMVDVLVEQLSSSSRDAMLDEVGHRVARALGAPATGSFDARVRAAADALVALGGDVAVEASDNGLRIKGSGCPLSSVVSEHPEMCRAVETMIGDVTGATTVSCCEHGPQPRCRFDITEESAKPAA